jgi:WD40 repeat protein
MFAEVDLSEGTIHSRSRSAGGRRVAATAMPPAGRPSPSNGSGYFSAGLLTDTSTWNVVATQREPAGAQRRAQMEFHPSGRTLRSGDGIVQVLSGDDLSILGEAPGRVSGIASRNTAGTRFASGGSGAGTFVVWDTVFLAPIATYSTDLVMPMRSAWSNDGQQLLAQELLVQADGLYRSTIEHWDLAVGERQLMMGFDGNVQDSVSRLMQTSSSWPALGSPLWAWLPRPSSMCGTGRPRGCWQWQRSSQLPTMWTGQGRRGSCSWRCVIRGPVQVSLAWRPSW